MCPQKKKKKLKYKNIFCNIYMVYIYIYIYICYNFFFFFFKKKPETRWSSHPLTNWEVVEPLPNAMTESKICLNRKRIKIIKYNDKIIFISLYTIFFFSYNIQKYSKYCYYQEKKKTLIKNAHKKKKNKKQLLIIELCLISIIKHIYSGPYITISGWLLLILCD
jgi:hypothetical protein